MIKSLPMLGRMLAIVLMVLTPLCVVASANEAALYDAAKKEGSVVWYTALIQKTLVRPMVAAFEAKYPGIEVTVVGGKSTDILLRLLSEAEAGVFTADLITPTRIDKLKQGDLVATYRPEAARDFPAEFKDINGQWTTLIQYVLGTAINTDLVKAEDAPRSLDDYLDPRWKGKLAWASMLTPAAGPGFAAAVLRRKGEEKGSEYLSRLARQGMINVAANQRVVLDQLIMGEFPVALLMLQHQVYESKQKGAPVEWLDVDPVTKLTDEIVLLKRAPHPNAGKLLMEFMLSQEGAAIIAGANYTPARPGVASNIPSVETTSAGLKPIIYGPEDSDAELDKWIDTYLKYFR